MDAKVILFFDESYRRETHSYLAYRFSCSFTKTSGRLSPFKPCVCSLTSLKDNNSNKKRVAHFGMAKMMKAESRVKICRVVNESMAKEKDVPQQFDLFTDYEELERQKKEEQEALERREESGEARLAIKQRFGKNAILKGLNFEEGATAKERNEQIAGQKA